MNGELFNNKSFNAFPTNSRICANTMSIFSGMNQFSQMGMQSMGQRSTPPLPMVASGNQVSAEATLQLWMIYY